MGLKKKANKCTVVEPEGKTNNALLKAVVRAHLWKRQLEEGKYRSLKELSIKINIGTRRIQQILRLNYLAPKIKEDIVNGRQPSSLRLADLREIPMLWSEQGSKIQEPSISSSADIEQQPTVVTAETTTAKDENSKEKRKAQNDSVETTVEPTSVDRETNEQEPNPAEIELCFTIDEKDKPPTKTTQQRQAILASVVGAALLVSSIIACVLKMYAIAAIGGIVGLACIGFALYNIINPNTKLEKVESVEQPIVESSLSLT
ncbi:site-specific recombinase, resolvase family [Trichonephila clavata]|uniref:Site-specific recombinase, resolvase family n=1 Tax=Trichonephila clavata TaxID=2740835 RepID=A0A8X6FX77_TRICU|nr:site-specific recombinase, resolvase family [Trichonephila clavata]